MFTAQRRAADDEHGAISGRGLPAADLFCGVSGSGAGPGCGRVATGAVGVRVR
jgi:hypothetical protein